MSDARHGKSGSSTECTITLNHEAHKTGERKVIKKNHLSFRYSHHHSTHREQNAEKRKHHSACLRTISDSRHKQQRKKKHHHHPIMHAEEKRRKRPQYPFPFHPLKQQSVYQSSQHYQPDQAQQQPKATNPQKQQERQRC